MGDLKGADKIQFLPTGCVACQQSKHTFLDRTAVVEIRTHTYVCECGATTVFFHGHEKFELLFEAGLQALTEGFLREAILDFTGCLERTYESVVQTLLASQGCDEDTVEGTWKQVAASSERQLGMFLGLWASEFGKPPARFSQKQVGLRNDVVHKGVFCTDDQAIAYGQAVWDFWAAHWGPVADKHHKRIFDLWRRRSDKAREGLLAGQIFVNVQATKNMSSLIPVHRVPVNVAEVIAQKRQEPSAHSYAVVIDEPRALSQPSQTT